MPAMLRLAGLPYAMLRLAGAGLVDAACGRFALLG